MFDFPRLHFLFVLLANSILLSAQNSLPEITAIEVDTDTLNNQVVFTFDLYDAENDTLEVDLRISADGGTTFLFPADSLEGDVGYPVLQGNQKQIIWHYDPDIGSLPVGTGFYAKIIAEDGYKIEIQDLVDSVDMGRLQADLEWLEGVRHPVLGLEKLNATKDSMENRFMAKGLQTERQEFPDGNYTAANITGRHPGLKDEAVTYIIDGHYDTVSGSPRRR